MSAELPRRTKIVATLGPASSSQEMVLELARAGMDVARLNFSHGTHEDHAKSVALVREVARGGRAADRGDRRSPGPEGPDRRARGARDARPRRGSHRRGRGVGARRRASGQPDRGRRGAPARSRHPHRRRAHPPARRVGGAWTGALLRRHRRCRCVAQGRERPGRSGSDPVAHAQGHGRPRLRPGPSAWTSSRSRSCARPPTCAT